MYILYYLCVMEDFLKYKTPELVPLMYLVAVILVELKGILEALSLQC